MAATVLVACGLVVVVAAWLPAGTAHPAPTVQLDVTAEDNGLPCSVDGGECWFTIEKDGQPLSGESPDLGLERGATVEVTFANDGSFDHSFEVGPGCCGDGGYGGTETISPDETDTATFQVPWDAAGAGEYWCRPHGSSMTGDVTVEGGNAAPTLAVDAPQTGATVEGTVEVSGTAGDDDGDTVTVEVQAPPGDDGAPADGSDAWSYEWDTTAVDDGDHTIRVTATDQHGFETVVERTVTVDNPLPPEIAIDRPVDGAQVTGNVSVEGTASDPDDDLDAVEVRLPPDDAWRTADGLTGWSADWNATGLEPGTYTLRARAVDLGGRTAETNVTVEVVAPGRPRVTVTSPADGATVNGTVQVEGTAEDPEGELSHVEVRVDDGAWRAAAGTTTWNASLDLEPGDHTISARAIAGDRSSPPVSVTVAVPSTDGSADGNGTVPDGDDPIQAPEEVTVSSLGDRFLVEWSPVADATAYRVHRALGDGFEQIARTTGTSYADGTVPTGSTPSYRVGAEGPNGTALSEAVSAADDPRPALPLPVWVAVAGWLVAAVVAGRRGTT